MLLVDNRNITDPYINLAIEEYLVRAADCNGREYLFLYSNEPSIVIGKNQSIYREVNFEYLRNGRLKLCRRISGGGAVYHDLGNLNFSFISKFDDSKINNYRFFNAPLVEVLRNAGVHVEMDERNNILHQGRKISGNAQFTNRTNIISHGTLLFNADLPVLRAALKDNDFAIETRAVASVKSSVVNIAEVSDAFSSVDELKTYLAKGLNAHEVFELNEEAWKEVKQLAVEKFSTFEWIYGRSPKTTITRNSATIEIENGLITHATELNTQLQGTRYAFDEIKRIVTSLPYSGINPEDIF